MQGVLHEIGNLSHMCETMTGMYEKPLILVRTGLTNLEIARYISFVRFGFFSCSCEFCTSECLHDVGKPASLFSGPCFISLRFPWLFCFQRGFSRSCPMTVAVTARAHD